MSVVAQQRKPLGQVTENEALSRQERLMQWRAAKKHAGSANVNGKTVKEQIAAPRPAPTMVRNAPVANLPKKPAVPRVAAASASAAKRPPSPKPAPTVASKKVPIAAKKAGIPPRAPRPNTVKPAPAPTKVAIAKKPAEVVVSAVTATTNRPPVAKMNVVSSTNLWQKKHKKANVKAAKAGKEMTLDENMFPALDELDDAPLGGDLPDEAEILRIEVKELRSIIDQQNDDINSLKIKLAEKEKECDEFRTAAAAAVTAPATASLSTMEGTKSAIAIVEEQRQTKIAAIDKSEQLSPIESAVEAAPVPMLEEISSTEIEVEEAHKDDDSVPSTDVVASSNDGIDSRSTIAPEQSVAAISGKAAEATEDIAEHQHIEEESDQPATVPEENRDVAETAADNALADSLVSLDDVNASVSDSNLGDLSFDFTQDE